MRDLRRSGGVGHTDGVPEIVTVCLPLEPLPAGGSCATAPVEHIPFSERVGVFLDVESVAGFIDVFALPVDLGDWPPVDTVLDVEILRHRAG